MTDEGKPHPVRLICLLCGFEIEGPAVLKRKGHPLDFGFPKSVVVHRDLRPTRNGFAHYCCAAGKRVFNRTGQPDYAGYDEDGWPD